MWESSKTNKVYIHLKKYNTILEITSIIHVCALSDGQAPIDFDEYCIQIKHNTGAITYIETSSIEESHSLIDQIFEVIKETNEG